MYWSVWASAGGAGSRIETAGLDGSARRLLVAGELHWPNGLALSADAAQLYWCDTYLDKIERLELATGERRVLAAHSPATPVLKPYGLALHDGRYRGARRRDGEAARRGGGATDACGVRRRGDLERARLGAGAAAGPRRGREHAGDAAAAAVRAAAGVGGDARRPQRLLLRQRRLQGAVSVDGRRRPRVRLRRRARSAPRRAGVRPRARPDAALPNRPLPLRPRVSAAPSPINQW